MDMDPGLDWYTYVVVPEITLAAAPFCQGGRNPRNNLF